MGSVAGVLNPQQYVWTQSIDADYVRAEHCRSEIETHASHRRTVDTSWGCDEPRGGDRGVAGLRDAAELAAGTPPASPRAGGTGGHIRASPRRTLHATGGAHRAHPGAASLRRLHP